MPARLSHLLATGVFLTLAGLAACGADKPLTPSTTENPIPNPSGPLNLGDVVRSVDIQRGKGPVFMFGNARAPQLLDAVTAALNLKDFPRAGEPLALATAATRLHGSGNQRVDRPPDRRADRAVGSWGCRS